MLPLIQGIMERMENKEVSLGEDPLLVPRFYFRKHGAPLPDSPGLGANRFARIDLLIFKEQWLPF